MGGDGNENSKKKKKKKTIGLSSKKKNNNNFACVAHFFCVFLCRCFVRRQRETSRNFLVTRFIEESLYVVLFPYLWLPLIFTLVPASISHFLRGAIKFHVILNEIGLLCFLISVSSTFSVIHANVDFKIKLKERIGFVVVVFYL